MHPTQLEPSESPTCDARSLRVLVTLPVYNEATILRNSVDSVLTVMRQSGFEFTLSIAEDGSTDGTKDCIREIQKLHPEIIVQTDDKKRGRGWALRTLWSKVRADYYAFSDADFAADPRYLLEGIKIALSGRSVVTGSRYVRSAHVSRPPLRKFVSRGYNQLTRVVFADGIQDHQCGLKIFSREALALLLPRSHEDSWFWDTEMLVLAHDNGLSITEFPVDWTEKKTKRTSMIRLLSDVYLHGTGILRLVGNRSKQ